MCQHPPRLSLGAEADRIQSAQSHSVLASLADRVTRLEALAGALAPLLGVAPEHLIQRLMVAPDYHAAAGQVAEELRARCLPVVEWTPVGRSYIAVVGRHEMIVVPDGALSIWSFGWQLAVTGTQDDAPCSVVLDSGPETGEAGKAAAVAAWRRERENIFGYFMRER